MPSVRIRDQKSDDGTSARSGILEIGKVRDVLPNKFATTSETGAFKLTALSEIHPGNVIVAARLMFPNTLKRLLNEEKFLKQFARGISRGAAAEDIAHLLYLSFRGEARLADTDDLKTILDLQFFSDLDLVTVQQTPTLSPDEFTSFWNYARRWSEERGVDKPIMPVVPALDSRENFERVLEPVVRRRPSCLGLDMHGSFYYHSLRAIENLKKRTPEMWVHAFQVPPKVRFGGRLTACSEGMILPYFGVDSFSRWIVPPPPVPLTKDKINMFDRSQWSVFKRGDWREIHGSKLGCRCAACRAKNLNSFFAGKVLSVLARSKVHDHLAQRNELDKATKKIKDGEFTKLLQSKKGPKEFLKSYGATAK